MKKNHLVLLIFLIPIFSFSQTLDFLEKSTSEDVFTSHQFHASAYHDGYFYLAGDYWKDISFGSLNLSLPTDETRHSFILKMSETGEVEDLWELSSSEFARINKIVVNPSDKTLTVIGGFWNNMIYGNVELSTPYFGDGFVMNLNLDGSLNWMKQLTSQNANSFSFGEAVVVDKVGNLFVGFEMFGTLDLDGVEYETSSESFSALIVKLDPNGNVLATQTWLGTTFENIIDIVDLAVDEDNNLIIAGGVFGTIEVNGFPINVFSNATQSIVVKESSELDLIWVKQFIGGNSIVNDINMLDDKLLVSLQYNSFCEIDDIEITGSGSWGDLAILSMDMNGDTEVLQNLTLTQNGGTAGVYGIDMVEYDGNMFIGGFYQGNVENEEGILLENTQSNDFQFPFILSINESGEIQNTYDFEGSNGPSRVQAIAASEERLLFSGEFSSQLSIEDTTIQTVNSTLFYGTLSDGIVNSTIDLDNDIHCVERIAPSIVNSSLTIFSKEALERIQIVDASGKLIRSISTNNQVNPNIQVEDLDAGVYFIRVECENGIKAFKFIKK